MATDWLTRLGRKRFESLIDDAVQRSVEKSFRDRIEPRLAAIENGLVAVETRLDVADRLAKLEAAVSALKASS